MSLTIYGKLRRDPTNFKDIRISGGSNSLKLNPCGTTENIFISWKSLAMLMTYLVSYILNHSINFKLCDVMICISTWGSVHFWAYLLNHKSFSHETWPTSGYSHGQYFYKILCIIFLIEFWIQALFNLLTYSNLSKTNYNEFAFLYSFQGVLRDNEN